MNPIDVALAWFWSLPLAYQLMLAVLLLIVFLAVAQVAIGSRK